VRGGLPPGGCPRTLRSWNTKRFPGGPGWEFRPGRCQAGGFRAPTRVAQQRHGHCFQRRGRRFWAAPDRRRAAPGSPKPTPTPGVPPSGRRREGDTRGWVRQPGFAGRTPPGPPQALPERGPAGARPTPLAGRTVRGRNPPAVAHPGTRTASTGSGRLPSGQSRPVRTRASNSRPDTAGSVLAGSEYSGRPCPPARQYPAGQAAGTTRTGPSKVPDRAVTRPTSYPADQLTRPDQGNPARGVPGRPRRRTRPGPAGAQPARPGRPHRGPVHFAVPKQAPPESGRASRGKTKGRRSRSAGLRSAGQPPTGRPGTPAGPGSRGDPGGHGVVPEPDEPALMGETGPADSLLHLALKPRTRRGGQGTRARPTRPAGGAGNRRPSTARRLTRQATAPPFAVAGAIKEFFRGAGENPRSGGRAESTVLIPRPRESTVAGSQARATRGAARTRCPVRAGGRLKRAADQAAEGEGGHSAQLAGPTEQVGATGVRSHQPHHGGPAPAGRRAPDPVWGRGWPPRRSSEVAPGRTRGPAAQALGRRLVNQQAGVCGTGGSRSVSGPRGLKGGRTSSRARGAIAAAEQLVGGPSRGWPGYKRAEREQQARAGPRRRCRRAGPPLPATCAPSEMPPTSTGPAQRRRLQGGRQVAQPHPPGRPAGPRGLCTVKPRASRGARPGARRSTNTSSDRCRGAHSRSDRSEGEWCGGRSAHEGGMVPHRFVY